MNRILSFWILVLIVLSSGSHLYGQGFKAVGILALNASQLDGDSLYGYRKLGLSAGARLSYKSTKNFDVAIEMLYSQRGSALQFFNNQPGDVYSLNYVEFPVIFSLRDWFQEKGGYHKVYVDAGLSYAYLLNANAQGYDESNFKKHDLAYLFGIGIRFTKLLGLGIRYTSSFGSVYTVENAPDVQLKSYFLTLRSEFHF